MMTRSQWVAMVALVLVWMAGLGVMTTLMFGSPWPGIIVVAFVFTVCGLTAYAMYGKDGF